jgi:flavin reductase (DIM6/NTAB) family NADH-FMN oxidoreductase RutF
LLGNDDLQSICVNLSKKYVKFIEKGKKFKWNLLDFKKQSSN